MPGFVIGDALLFVTVHDALLFLQTCSHTFDAFVEVLHLNGGAPAAGGKQSGFVDQIGQFGSRKTGADRSDLVQFHIGIEFHVLDMHLEDCFASFDVWAVDQDMTVKTTRTH